MRESQFQALLIKDLRSLFPDCVVLKTDPSYKQGIPDLLILCGGRWAALECKVSPSAHRQPNQEYYIGRMNELSFASFIFPENRDEVLARLKQYFIQ